MSARAPVLFIIRGLPGSGKTAVADEHAAGEPEVAVGPWTGDEDAWLPSPPDEIWVVGKKAKKTPLTGGRSPKGGRIVHCFCEGEHNHGCPRGM